MSIETVLPPQLPEDAAKSGVTPTPNIVETTDTKLITNNIGNIVVDIGQYNSQVYPFLHLARGVLARAMKASISVIGQETPGVYWKYTYPLSSTEDDCISIIALYFYSIYQRLLKGETSLPYHPRTVGFLLHAYARNRIAVTNGINTLYIVADASSPSLGDKQNDLISNFFRHEALGYDLVNVPVFESGPFPSSIASDSKAPVEEVKMTLDAMGSVYTSYTEDSGTFYLTDYYSENVSPGTWWIKACLSFDYINLPGTMVPSSTWANIAVHPNMLCMWTTYMDVVCDVPYVMSSAYPYPWTEKEPVEGTYYDMYPYTSIVKTLRVMAQANDFSLDKGAFDPSTPNLTSSIMRNVYMFCSCIYSPFGAIAGEFYYFDPATIKVQGFNSFTRMGAYCNWRRPIFLPSMMHESIASVAEQTILKSTNNGVTRTIQIFHMTTWPMLSKASGETNVFYYILINDLYLQIQIWESALMYRRFLKMNLCPEYKLNKAIMPYFFLHVPVNRVITGSSTPNTFDGVMTPYSVKYIEDHNLHIFARTMMWPRVFRVTQNMVAWLNIVDLAPITNDPVFGYSLPAVDTGMMALLMLDTSYMADGCEVDAYLHKMRTSHLGFFAALAGLLPTALKVGTALFKTIAKPKAIDAVMPQTSNVDQVQTNNMAMAGVSSLSQTLGGTPGSGGTVDLSDTVQVDPIEKVLEAGKRYLPKGKLSKMVSFGGKALKIGRQTYKEYNRMR